MHRTTSLMRLDAFLKESRLIKRRSVANEACDLGHILVNDTPAKAGKEVRPEDTITIRFRHRTLIIRVLFIPTKGKAHEPCFTVITDNPLEAL